jgi:hypothetical protein
MEKAINTIEIKSNVDNEVSAFIKDILIISLGLIGIGTISCLIGGLFVKVGNMLAGFLTM